MDEIMKKSGCEKPIRPVPKDVEESFEKELKDENDEIPTSEPPEYKTVYVDEEIEGKNDNIESNDKENKDDNVESNDTRIDNVESKDIRADKLNMLLQQLKKDDEKSEASDDLEDSLPVKD